ncbi:hypothetical protein AX16_001529 [Volvariella volvacea WC 439]|nr:hypothetical protein AX16_001529 [Volvariella volvacea WC 439]
MANPPYPAIPVTGAPRTLIDLKANGEVSRMRNHRGNMPSLPQTKYCTLCPAKFTRTTHLNRHLRSHTNERLHRCNTCSAEFTRSDLLTRHKRTCGDSANANRSRRKSCQACAESKVKCNLQYPCSKCSSRGKECIFINDPEASRNKRNAKKAQRTTSPNSSSEGVSLPVLSATSHPSFSISPASPLSSNSIATSPARLESGFSTLISSASSSSSSSSPRTDFFETRNDVPYDLELDTLTLDTQLNQIFSTSTFDPFLDQSFSPCSTQPQMNDFTWVEGGNTYYPGYSDDGFALPPNEPLVPPPVDYQNNQLLGSMMINQVPSSQAIRSSPSSSALGTLPRISQYGEPTAAELEHYLYSFISEFSLQVPVIHPSTWQVEGKPFYLIRAMQACGATFAQTRTAQNFVSDVLLSSRDALMFEVAKNSSDFGENVNLLLSLVLLQSIGLFHQKVDQRRLYSVYHSMLVTVIRRSGLLDYIGTWLPPDLSDPHTLDIAWRGWISYETIKRALWLSYLHDCIQCMNFATPPTYLPEEFDNVPLPCDDTAWKANSSRGWADVLPSGHQSAPLAASGSASTRITGVRMQHALSMLRENHLQSIIMPLNPFAQFVLIHTVLRDLYTSQVDLPGATISGSLSDATSPPAPNSVSGLGLGINRNRYQFNNDDIANRNMDGMMNNDATFAIQRALQNWLHIWLSSPETAQLTGTLVDGVPVVYDAMPYYWLAQASLITIQGNIAQGGAHGTVHGSNRGVGGSGRRFCEGLSPEGRFRLMKDWLERIKVFIRGGSQVPNHLWEELVQILVKVEREDRQVRMPSGLLSFGSGAAAQLGVSLMGSVYGDGLLGYYP